MDTPQNLGITLVIGMRLVIVFYFKLIKNQKMKFIKNNNMLYVVIKNTDLNLVQDVVYQF